MKKTDLVNIKQGSASVPRFSSGNTLPMTALPHAMTMFAPQTKSDNGTWFYHPADRRIEGIRLTHAASPWVGDWSYFTFMPQTDTLICGPDERNSGFDPEKAILMPHYMEIDLLRFRTKVALAPTDSGAIISVLADESVKTPVFAVLPFDFKTQIEVDEEKRTVYGYTCSYSHAPYRDDFKIYFVFEFDCDISGVMREKVGENGEALGVKTAKNAYTVRLATSFISIDQAKLNLKRELSGKSFEDVKCEAESVWEDMLSRIEIKADKDTMRTFYSCMYRALLFPNKLYETGENGKNIHIEPESGEIKEGVSYTNNGFWDTYRTVYPLYSLICPEKIEELVRGFLNVYDDVGALPRWLTPSEFNCMPGTLIEAVLADASAKGLLSSETERRALMAMVANSERKSEGRRIARKCVDEYKKLGYIPYDKCIESVNETLDCAYGDFCISSIAGKLGEVEIAEKYAKRSKNYKNLFDADYGLMRAKDSNGNFRDEEFDPFAWGRDYTEGSAWQASFAVPHDYVGLASLYGGKEQFLKKMDELFAHKPLYSIGGYPFEIHEMTEMAACDFGQCAISNQPSFHIPFMYAEFGEKKKSKKILKEMVKEAFSYKNDGFPGDEDNGTMASWYIFALLGFYPTCPGKDEFTVSGKLVRSAKLRIGNKKVNLGARLRGKNKIKYADIMK